MIWGTVPSVYAQDATQALLDQLPALLNQIQQRNNYIEKRATSLTEGGGLNINTAPVVNANSSSPIQQHTPHYALTPTIADYQQRSQFHPYKSGIRDPFTPTIDIERASVRSDSPQFSPASTIVRIPKLTLKGITYKDDAKYSIALLDIAGNGVHMVRVGDEISINPADPKEVIKIRKIDRLSLIVEFGTLGDLIIVR